MCHSAQMVWRITDLSSTFTFRDMDFADFAIVHKVGSLTLHQPISQSADQPIRV